MGGSRPPVVVQRRFKSGPGHRTEVELDLASWMREFINWDVDWETDLEKVKRDVKQTQAYFKRVFRKHRIPVISEGMRKLMKELKDVHTGL